MRAPAAPPRAMPTRKAIRIALRLCVVVALLTMLSRRVQTTSYPSAEKPETAIPARTRAGAQAGSPVAAAGAAESPVDASDAGAVVGARRPCCLAISKATAPTTKFPVATR